MQRSSTKIFVLSILIMAILAVVASTLVFDFSKFFQTGENVNIVNAATSYVSTDIAVLPDGQGVVGGAASGTAIGNGATWNSIFCAGFKSSREISGSYYLSSDITLSKYGNNAPTTSGSNGYIGADYYDKFTGTLDGRGNKIYINVEAGLDSGSAIFGAIADDLGGTDESPAVIKNITFVITKLRYNTGLTNGDIWAGGLFGQATSAVIFSNVKVEWNDEGTNITTKSNGSYNWTMHAQASRNSDKHYYYVGGYIGKNSGAVTFNNCTFELNGVISQMNWRDRSSSLNKVNQYVKNAAFIGEVYATTSFNGCSFTGNGGMFCGREDDNDDRRRTVMANGVLTAVINGANTRINVAGFYYGFTGSYSYRNPYGSTDNGLFYSGTENSGSMGTFTGLVYSSTSNVATKSTTYTAGTVYTKGLKLTYTDGSTLGITGFGFIKGTPTNSFIVVNNKYVESNSRPTGTFCWAINNLGKTTSATSISDAYTVTATDGIAGRNSYLQFTTPTQSGNENNGTVYEPTIVTGYYGYQTYNTANKTKTYDGDCYGPVGISYFYNGETQDTISDADYWDAKDSGNNVISDYSTVVNVGTYTIYPNVSDLATGEDYVYSSGNYYDSTNHVHVNVSDLSAQSSLSITQRNITVTIANKTSEYGENLVERTSSVTTGSIVSGDTNVYSLSTAASNTENAGNYPITGTTNNSNYNITYVNGTYTITKATLTLTPTINTPTYNGSSFEGLVISPSQLAGWKSTDAYTDSSNGGYIANFECVASQNSPTITGSGSLACGDYSSFSVTAVNAKTYSVTVTLEMTNYVVSGFTNNAKTYSFTINKANYDPTNVVTDTLTYTGEAQSPLDSLPPALEGFLTVTYYDVAYASISNAHIIDESEVIDVNTYCVVVAIINQAKLDADPNASNYTVAAGHLDFYITKATLTITAKPHSIVYGENAANNGVTYSGFLGIDSVNNVVFDTPVAYTYTYGQSSYNVGNYLITPTSATTRNYSIEFVSGTLTVTPKPLTITPDDISITYGAAIPNYTFSTTALGRSDTIGSALNQTGIVYSCDYDPNDDNNNDVDTYVISVDGITANYGNYNISYGTGLLTVGKANLNVKANNKTLTYGDAPANAGVTYTGFKNGDGAGNLGGTLTYNYGGYAQYSDVGEYDITPSGYNSSNYTITYQKGTLTVGKKALTITRNNYNEPYDTASHGISVTVDGIVNNDAFSIYYSTSTLDSSNYDSYGSTTNITRTNAQSAETIYYYVTAGDNYNTYSGLGTITISRRIVRIRFDDTKELYDSVLDVTGNYYDFIYVSGADNFSSTYFASLGYSSFSDYFKETYKKYFTKLTMYGTAPASGLDFSTYLTVDLTESNGGNELTPSASTGSYYLTFKWTNKATSEMLNNYTLDGTIISTTGAGANAGFSSYCESAVNSGATSWATKQLRIVIVSNQGYNGGYDVDYSTWDHGGSTYTSSNLYKFMSSHYYDQNNTFAQKTTFTFTNALYVDRAFITDIIIPSYKTIDFNNKAIVFKNNVGCDNKGGDWYTPFSITKTTKSYYTINDTTFYAVGLLAAINYGVVKRSAVNYWEDTDSGAQYLQININMLSDNTAFGGIVGVNAGILDHNSVARSKIFRFNATTGYAFTFGWFAGINVGTISYSSDNTLYVVDDLYSTTFGNHYLNVHNRFEITGNSTATYYGMISGINDGIIDNFSSNTSNIIPTQIALSSGTLYAGGVVGYNKSKGKLTTVTYYNYQCSYDGTKSFDGGWVNGPTATTFTYRGAELSFTTSGSNYSGGICGWNEGRITNATYIDQSSVALYANLSTTGYTAAIGGIAGVNGGTISNANITIAGNMFAGKETASAFEAYVTAGGIAGVNSSLTGNPENGGNISNCTVIIRPTGHITAKRGTGNNITYAGGLLGVGCEIGTINSLNKVTFAGVDVAPGTLANCTMFNYGKDGNNNWTTAIDSTVYWGYLTGCYSAVPMTNGYTHAYSSLIWYTQYDAIISSSPISYYTKTLFGAKGAILGYNGGSSSSGVSITGVAGIGLKDCGDGTLSSTLLDGVTLDPVNGKIIVSYNDFSSAASSGGYTGWDCLVNGNVVNIYIGNTEYTKTTAFAAGTIKADISNANAAITNTADEAAIAYFVIRPYVEIKENDDYLNFLSTSYATNKQGKDATLYYCAGYGVITSWTNGTMTGDPWEGVMNQYKTLDGLNPTNESIITITYQPGSIKNGDAVWPNSAGFDSTYTSTSSATKHFYGAGNLVAVNHGTIRNINLVMQTNGTNAMITGPSNRDYAYGIVSAINTGTIENCTVTIEGGGYNGIAGSTSGNQYYVGAIAGLSHGTISGCTVKFREDATLTIYGDSSYNYNTSKKGFLGGIAGLVSGGRVEDCVVIGKGNIKTTNATTTNNAERNLGAYVGGIAGYMLLDNTLGEGDVDSQSVSHAYGVMRDNEGNSTIKNLVVELIGEITSMASGSIGGSGYITGRAFATNNSNTIDDLIGDLNFGTLFVVAGGTPNIVSTDSPKWQNAIFGKANVEPASNSYTALTNLSTVLFEDYSAKGLGAMKFASALALTYARTGMSTYLSGKTFSVTYDNNNSHVISVAFSNAGTSSPSISSVLTRTTPSGASSVSEVITNNTTALEEQYRISGASNITSSTNNPWIMYTISYGINITGESLTWDDNIAMLNSPFINFISGRGYQPLYAGAKEATLLGDITFNKHLQAAIEFKEGKVLNGNNRTIYSIWAGGADNQIAGVSDSAVNTTPGAGIVSNEEEYPNKFRYTNDGTSITFYGVSDLISINYGTIRELTVSVSTNGHFFNGLNANVAYGSIAGVNAGTIEKCRVFINKDITYAIGAADKYTVVGLAVGLNVGTISELNVELRNATFAIIDKQESTAVNAPYTGNIVFSGAVGINGYNGGTQRGSIVGLYVTNSGTMRIGSDVDGQYDSDISASNAQEMNRKINSATMAGLVGINAGGALSYASIKGTGAFIINAVYYATTKEGNEVVAVTNTNLYNINYAYFAALVALTNNTNSSSDYQTGINVISNLVEGTNQIHHLMIEYSGAVQYYAAHYMVGLAFAKAANTVTASAGTEYKAIIWNEAFNNDLELYVHNNTWGADANISIGIASAGLSLMGWVDTTTAPATFVSGTQIKSNVASQQLSWEKAGDLYTGDLIYSTTEVGMKDKAPIASITVNYLPSGDTRENLLNNSNYYVFTKGETSSTIVFELNSLISNNVLVNGNTTNYAGNALQINITFNYPLVEINDVYQLVQYLWFDSSDSSNMVSYYLRTYINEIKLLIDNGLKKATRVNPYGAWADFYDSDIETILSHYNEDDYYIIYYQVPDENTPKYYYVFLEKYYDEDGDEIPYYSANLGRLGTNIKLNKFGQANPDFGFDTTTWREFPQQKQLDGQGYSIELIVTKYPGLVGQGNALLHSTSSYTNTAGRTVNFAQSKWYDSGNSNTISEWTLSDNGATPSKGTSTFIFGGFVGINRGKLKNIHFIFAAGSILNITDENLAKLKMDRNAFVGLISAYSTGEIDGCTLELGDNSQVFVNKYLSKKVDDDNIGGVYLGGFAGVLGQNGIIANSTVDFGANVKFGAHNVGSDGSFFSVFSCGHIYTYVGGFAGIMAGGSQIYNAKIEGSADSRIFACINETRFTRVITAAGGLVGVNTVEAQWNQWNIGEGSIDGVIYNWKGRTISAYWNGGLKLWGWEPNAFGDRETVTLYELSGNVAGAIGDMVNNEWATLDTQMKNLYYTFDIADYIPKDNNGNITSETHVTLRNANGSSGTTDFRLRNHDSKNTLAPSANVAVSDAINEAETLNNIIKVLAVYEIPYAAGATGIGITIPDGTSTEYNSGKNLVVRNYTSFTASSAYEKLTTLGDLLSWSGTTKGANISCKFNAGQDKASAIMWQITIENAESTSGSTLNNPASGNATTIIPVYKFAKSLEEAQRYKTIDYTILRGQGDGMRLYYCMGDSAILSPDLDYYTNDYTNDITTYYPKKALMYDGATDGNSASVSIYDGFKQPITRVSSATVASIISNAGNKISRVTKVLKNGQYTTEVAENESIKDIGSYKVEFTIKTNGLNDNAYVDATNRVMFFNAQGAEAVNEIVETYTIYMVIAPISIDITSVTKLYDGHTDLNYFVDADHTNYSTIKATLNTTFTYSDLTSPTIEASSRTGKMTLKSGSNSYASILPAGRYDSAEVGGRTVEFNMGGEITYTLYRYDNVAKHWYLMNITSYYLADATSTKTYYTIGKLTTLLSKNDTSYVETYGCGETIVNNKYSITDKTDGVVVKIYTAAAPTFSFDSNVVISRTYTGYSIDYVTGSDLLSRIRVTNSLGDTWAASDSTYFNDGDFTIEALTANVQNVRSNAYPAQIKVTYNGDHFPTGSDGTLSLSVYVTPAELQVVKVLKNYDGNANITNATTVVMTGFKGSDTQGAVTGTFAKSDVDKNINVTFTGLTNISINNTSYSTIFTNYVLAQNPTPIGVIAPVAATIENAYKTYDGTKTVTYTGTNATHLLIKQGNTVLNIKPNNAEFSSNQVGQCSFIVPLQYFDYEDASGVKQVRYILKDGSANTNYYLTGATLTRQPVANVGFILPKEIQVTAVYKDYDGTTALGTFVTSGILTGDSITSFDGVYASADVVYDNGTYNDIELFGVSRTFTINDGTNTSQVTKIVLKNNSSSTNYTLDTTLENVDYKENDSLTYVVEGVGVIIPGLATIDAVIKYYDAKATFNSATINALNDQNVYAQIIPAYNSSPLRSYVFTGTLSGKDAGTGYNVTPDTTNFVFNNVTYLWLKNDANAHNNFRVASATATGVGTILQVTIKLDTGSQSGSISNIYFTTSTLGNQFVDTQHYSSGAQVFETTYKYGQSYSSANFCGTLNLGGETYNIRGGSATVDGVTLTFTLSNSYTNYGIHSFEIAMSSTKANYILDSNKKTFYFGIDRQTLEAKDIQLVMANVTKVYNGTNSKPSVFVATAIRADTDEGYIVLSNGTFGGASITVGTSCKNAGTYIQGTASDQIVLSQVVNNRYSENYQYSGTLTSLNAKGIYASTQYSSTALTHYTITPATLTPATVFEKDFDGTTSFEVELDGVNGEKPVVTYSYVASSEGLGVLPGSYTGTASIASNNSNYMIAQSASITLTINKAKVVLERQYASANQFKLVLGITNVKSLGFLSYVNASLTSELLTIIENVGDPQNQLTINDSSVAPALAELGKAISLLYVFKCNDSTATTDITAEMIENIHIIEDEDGIKTYEIVLKGEATLDRTSLTDRYSIYMMGTTLDDDEYIVTSSVYGSNVAVSSSELADGQFSGTYTTIGTNVNSLDALKTVLTTNANGYLTTNIYGYDAKALGVTTYSGTLYGNGYTIEIVGDYAASSTYLGGFVAVLSGRLQDINFKFVSTVELDATGKTVGLVVGNNTGTIENCSLDIGFDINVKAATTPTIGGLTGTTSGTITHATVTYSDSITYATFGGIAKTITGGSVSYITVRNNATCASIAGKALADTTTVQISYVIDAITFTNSILTTANVTVDAQSVPAMTNVYGAGSTAVAMFDNDYTNGFVDYYFTTLGKYTTSIGALHNVYDSSAQGNQNMSYYYGYDANKSGYRVAIEVIAPLNRFVWEAFDAYYTQYSTALNRVVGLFDLTEDLANYNLEPQTPNATMFTPVIGKIARTVISSGQSTIKECEYTGSRITAKFDAEVDGKPIELAIAGTEVGSYTEYYEEVKEGEQATDLAWDIEGFTAQILTTSSAIGEQSIMLIIVPKQLNDAPTITKEYDSTNIAETHFNVTGNSDPDVYAVGEYSGTAVNTSAETGYQVKYNSITKPVAAYLNGGVYTFVTYYLSGFDDEANKKVYTVKFVYANGSPFTSNVNVTTLSKSAFAEAYYQLTTLAEIQAMAADTTHNIMIYANGITGINDSHLTSVQVYDLTFARTVNDETHEITWGNSVSYSTTIYNKNNTLNKNYNYLVSNNTFSLTSIVPVQDPTVAQTTQKVVTATEGRITQRTVNATYSNLNQSYRKALSPITVEIAAVNDLSNIPFSLTQQQKTDLIAAINAELANATFSADVLAATVADENNEDRTKITYNQEDSKYYATAQEYTTVQLTALNGTYSVTTNLAVAISESATLVLRYFEYLNGKYIIDTFDALMMVDSLEGDYQDLHYQITNNLNGKGRLVETLQNDFNGTINGSDGNGGCYVIRNFALVGSSSTSLFSTLTSTNDTTASISNVEFANVLLISTASANMSVVANENDGAISNVTIHAKFASDNAVTISPFANSGTGSVETSTAVTETIMTKDNVTINPLQDVDTIVMFRTFGLGNNAGIIYYLNSNSITSTYSAIVTANDKVPAIITTNRLNAPITISNDIAQVVNFRQYWAWKNIFPWLAASNSTTFTGYQFELR